MKNEFNIIDNVVHVECNSHGEKITFLVDEQDLEKINIPNRRWTSKGTKRKRYIVMMIDGKEIFIHHLLIGRAPIGMCVDHINGNKLDNRKSNLRFITYKQNAENRHLISKNNKSGKTGVFKVSENNKWCASIYHFGKQIRIGYFNTFEEAAEARDDKEKELFTHRTVV